MKLSKVLLALVIAAAVGFASCKPKDADIKAAVEKALGANADFAKAAVTVAGGVATITGEVKDEATKAALFTAVKAVSGVKEVVNNASVPPPPPPAPPVVIAADDPLAAGVKDATKDHPTVTATVAEGVITLSGSIEKSKLAALMQSLNSLKPKKIDNKLTVK